MGTLYLAIPKVSHAAVEVATGATLKTLLQVATPGTTAIRVLGWGVSFEGTSGAPGVLTLIETDVAATVTALTPEKWESEDAPVSLCVGGVAATGYNATAEGTIGASRILDAQELTPNAGGYSIWFPTTPVVKAGRFLRLRALFGADVLGIPFILYAEPA